METFRTIRPLNAIELRNYGIVRDRIIYRLINLESNRDILREISYLPWMDLAITFHVLVGADPMGTATMAIRNEHLRYWGVTTEQIYERAHANTKEFFPEDFKPMQAVFAELLGMPEMAGNITEDISYVLTNTRRKYGTVVLLYPGVLGKIGEILGEDFYVLPSSVHEAIILRKSAAGGEEPLGTMVEEVNEEKVGEDEVLSDKAYFYDRRTGTLSFEAR